MSEPAFQLCRNPRCRSRMPVAFDEHSQFCTRGCWEQFHRRRCVVCEAEFERVDERVQFVCGKRKCKAEARRRPDIYRPFHMGPLARPRTDMAETALNVIHASEVPVLQSLNFEETATEGEPERPVQFAPPHPPLTSKKMRDWTWRRGDRVDDDWFLNTTRMPGTRNRCPPLVIARVRQEGDGWWVAYPRMTPQPPIEARDAAKRRAEVAVMYAMPAGRQSAVSAKVRKRNTCCNVVTVS